MVMVFCSPMKFIADLHIHSRYSRATSKSLDPEQLFLWARKKGLSVIGTGDFTHPAWVSELREKLVESEDGLFRLNPGLEKKVEAELPHRCKGTTRFLLSGEISCIYKKEGRTRKVHHLVLLPDMASVERLQRRLGRIGNITSDGRPILGLDSHDLLEVTLEASDRAFFIPAHVWTPWFSLFGSKSGFDAIEECFGDLTPRIHCLETGLSSDPAMNRLISSLDRYVLVSNSDAHSPSKLGREANLFDTALDYPHLVRAMAGGNGFLGTVEFYPEEGKYHLDGHRKCNVRCDPRETEERKGVCPVCGKPMTVGVLNRIYELADRDEPIITKDVHSLIPLTEILSELLGCGPGTKKVMVRYEQLLSDLGPELEILRETPLPALEERGGELLAEAVKRMRKGTVIREAGYDGEYGRIRLFSPAERDAFAGQLAFFRSSEKPKRRSQSLKVRGKGNRSSRQKPGPPEDVPRESDPILSPLNDAQRKAVLHTGGHVLVIAGPGTGKTLTLTHRMAYLLQAGRASSKQILGLTFTRKAAREMEERMRILLGGGDTAVPRITTFHGFCLEMLRDEGQHIGLDAPFSICPEPDRDAIIREILLETASGKTGRRTFLKRLPLLKRAALPDGPEFPNQDETVAAMFRKYQQRLRDMCMLDLDDLEVEAYRLLHAHPDTAAKYALLHPYLFVDEYQDTNELQVAILKRITRFPRTEVFAIGDPDQAIYGFRGADRGNFFRFVADFPGAETVTLEWNYRSGGDILKGAAALIGREKPLLAAVQDPGTLATTSCSTEREEAEMIVATLEKLLGGTTYFSLDSGRVASHENGMPLSFSDIAVLYRLNEQGDALEEALSRAGIPLARSGDVPLIQRKPVRLICSFLEMLRYPENDRFQENYTRMLKEMGVQASLSAEPLPRSAVVVDLIRKCAADHGLGTATGQDIDALQRLVDWAELFDRDMDAFLDSLVLERGIDHLHLMGDRVGLMSLHAAKGLEWPVVFITGCEDKLIPCTLFGEKDAEEEKRLFYVGMTRARIKLILSRVRKRKVNGRVVDMGPSPFLEALPADICRPLDRGAGKPKGKVHRQLNLF